MAKTLILGGSGFVSGAFAHACAARGDQTFVLTRGTRPLPENITPLTADRNSAAFASELVRQDLPAIFDLVVDCIGFNAQHALQDLETFFPINGPARARHLVFISTDWVCSPVDRPLEIDETFDRFDTVPYGGGKRAAEEVFLRAVAERGAEAVPVTILRPCHIYGPGSLLGCVPLHGRDPELVERIKKREVLRLLGRGHFLQQPIFVEDLVAMGLACAANARTRGEVYFAAGPKTVECRRFYQVIGEILGVPVEIGEASISEYLKEHPENHGFCCHRVYAMKKARGHGLPVPGTGLRAGLERHLRSMGH